MGQQCCSGVCTPRDDPANCGVCGIACTNNRVCLSVPNPGGMNQHVCTCEADAECMGYGSDAWCVDVGLPTSGLCSCACVNGSSPCSGQCATGSCYDTGQYGSCEYP
jgi:hypothetical protein